MRDVLKQQTRRACIALMCVCACAAVATAAPSEGKNSHGSQNLMEVYAPVVVFWEDGFPAADTATPSRARFATSLPGAAFIPADQLADALAKSETQLLVMPFGSAFPEAQWDAIRRYLERGGNLLVLGGKPFTRAAYKDGSAWRLRPPIQAFARTLFLNDYAETPGSDAAKFTANEDFSFLKLPAFTWKRAWSATIRLTDEDLYKREGSAGTLDARLDPLAWGVANGRKLAAPIIEIDHVENHFAGGRWILVACELGEGFYGEGAGADLVEKLAKRAAGGAEDFTVQPAWPVFLPGEPLTFNLHLQSTALITGISRIGQNVFPHLAAARVDLTVTPEDGAPITKSFDVTPRSLGQQSMTGSVAQLPLATQLALPPSAGRGLHSVTAKLYINYALREIYRTGFWMRDDAALKSGPHLKVAADYFTVDDKPMLVAGTTYMASDVQRQFFTRPNPWLWNQDMVQIREAGFNMLRTGWWSTWDQIMKQPGVIDEQALRAMEAYLLTARKNGLAVQFTLFAFTPEVLGGENPYLDPETLRRQKDLLIPFVERFHDVPYLAWDLINEPSFSNPSRTWQTRPNGDAHELTAWNAWLNAHYKDHGAIAEAWRSATVPPTASVPLPSEAEFSSGRAQYEAWPANNALRAMDYLHFAQDAFRQWVSELTSAIRTSGSAQLITVGEDEGGGQDRPSPAIFGDAVDFTTTHSWWASDALLWDSLVAKFPGKPMLVQETGVSHEVQIDGEGHRTLDEEALLLERKLAIAAGTSAGAIEWLWNVNAYQRDDREATIGAVRPDGTEKPEAALMRRFAEFAAAAGPHMSGAQTPDVAIVTSQALQFSPIQTLAIDAQQKAVRATNYLCGVPAYVVTENQLANEALRRSALSADKQKLAILPAPQALSDEAWSALMNYVSDGGNLLVTGSVERDSHWRVTQRTAALGLNATPKEILLRAATQEIGDKTIALNFTIDKQQAAEFLQFSDGESLHVVTHGKGRMFLASEPVELAEGLQPAAQLYSWVMQQVGVRSPFEGSSPDGILVRPVILADSVLYLLVSESANAADLSLKDRLTGATITAKLAPGRAQLVLISRSNGQIIARFAVQ